MVQLGGNSAVDQPVDLHRFGETDGKEEGAALPHLALEPEPAAHQFGEALDNRQSQARPPIVSCGRCIGLSKGRKNPLLVLLRDSDAGVRHRKPQAHFAVRMSLGCDVHGYLALLGKLDRIADELEQDLP